ncbi:MAG: flagellar FlbD family protein [Spirochaetota bacterium]
MIQLTRLNGSVLYINCDHIETMEETPDTVIHLTSEKTYIVRDSIEEIINKVVEFRRRIYQKEIDV